MRGEWIINLTARVLNGSIGSRDAIRFAVARFSKKPTRLEISGVTFPNADHILWSLVADIFVNRIYTPAGFEITADDVIIDVGAHKGVFAAYAALHTTNTIRAVEPDSGNFAYLKSLVETHHWSNVELIRAAITDQAANEISLYRADSSSRNSTLGRDVVTGKELHEHQLVPAMNLESAIRDMDSIDLLKMDCEGAEFAILASAHPSTFAKIRRIVIEYHAEKDSEVLEVLVKRLRSNYDEVVVVPTSLQLGYVRANR